MNKRMIGRRADLKALEQEIAKGLKELEGMLGE